MLEHHIIVNGYITRSFICYVYIVSLLYKTYECTSHRNDVIVRMWRENDHLFRERCRRNRSCAVVSIRFSSRPSGNGMLKIVEYLYIDLCIRTVLLEKLSQTVLQVIALSEFQDRLVYLFAEPYYSFSDEFRSPFARTDKPRGYVSDKQACRIFVNI